MYLHIILFKPEKNQYKNKNKNSIKPRTLVCRKVYNIFICLIAIYYNLFVGYRYNIDHEVFSV